MTQQEQAHRIIWMTGGSSGIGAATALKLAKQGHQVALSARSEDKMQALVEQGQGRIHAFPLDVTKTKDVQRVFAEIEEKLGPVDMAFLNAGTYFPEDKTTFKVSSFQKTMDVNLIGMARCLEPALQAFRTRGRGHIVMMGSVAGYRGLPQSLCYSPSKAAIQNLAESLAIECYGSGIKVQVINPGFVRTPLTDKNEFDMPFRIEVEEAAEIIVKGLQKKKFEITFPWQFSLILKTLGLLPHSLYIPLLHKSTKGKLSS